jgi:hypothetical protein
MMTPDEFEHADCKFCGKPFEVIRPGLLLFCSSRCKYYYHDFGDLSLFEISKIDLMISFARGGYISREASKHFKDRLDEVLADRNSIRINRLGLEDYKELIPDDDEEKAELLRIFEMGRDHCTIIVEQIAERIEKWGCRFQPSDIQELIDMEIACEELAMRAQRIAAKLKKVRQRADILMRVARAEEAAA